jgi:phosphate transport system substrate-binding protein
MMGNGAWGVVADWDDVPENFYGRIKTSQTHGAILNLIDNQTDLIISARKMSADEQAYAQDAGVSLIETPIALDALDFLLYKNNTVTSLTVRQIQDIYTGVLTNWSEAGGADEAIKPLIRNPNSGSQEMMKEIVMHNTDIPEWEMTYADEEVVMSMTAAYVYLKWFPNAICFSPHYYKEYIVRDDMPGADYVKTVAVDGVIPDKNSIANKTYPFVAPVYVSIRSDLDRNSPAYKIYEWLQTSEGKSIIAESGYLPI